MRLLRVLAVRLGDALDRVRRALLSWAGVAEGVRDDTPGEDHRPAVWLDYIRAHAPWLIAGKRHLPVRSVPVLPPRPDASSTRVPDSRPPAPPKAVTPDQGQLRPAEIPAPPHAAHRATPISVDPVARAAPTASLLPTRPRSPSAGTRARDPLRALPTAPSRPVSPAPESAPRRTMSRPPLEAATRSSLPSKHVAEDPTMPAARRERPPALVSPARVVRPDAPRSAPQPWPRLLERAFPLAHAHDRPDRRRAVEHESDGGQQLLDPRRTRASEPSVRDVGRTVACVARSFEFDDVGLWADLPVRGFGEWQVQSSRSLIREQLHLARLLAEQAGSSWSALHS